MSREAHVRFCERPAVRFRRPTLPGYRIRPLDNLPADTANVRNCIEMLITTEYRHIVLYRQRGNPRVVCRYWPPPPFQVGAQLCIWKRGVRGNRQEIEIAQVFIELLLIGSPMSRTGDAIAKFTKNDYRDKNSRLSPQNASDVTVTVNKNRQRIGIENQSLSSGSMTSNSASTTDCIRTVSLCSRLSLPNPCIHRGSAAACMSAFRSSLSRSASVTKSLRDCPRSAAVAFALRKIGSGSSRVVFIRPY